MGCLNSKENRASKYAVSGSDEMDNAGEQQPKDKQGSAQATTPGKTAPAGNIVNLPRPNLDPEDFRFVDCKDDIKVKPPGSINGQSFMIDKCENCDIYILDHCGQVTMDDCKGCRVFIGPTDGSVFIRDCAGCSLAVICRQFRTRDCSDCRIGLYCRSKPIIESSVNMGFACFDLPYPGLQEHMRESKLSSFHNFWSDVFDFTPKEGGTNWQLLPAATTTASLLGRIPEEAASFLSAQDNLAPTPVLKTLGKAAPWPDGGCYMFVAFDGSKHEQAMKIARRASEQEWLLHTNESRLNPAAAAALATEAGWSKSVAKALAAGKVGCVGLELVLPESDVKEMQASVKQLGGHVSDSEAPGKAFRTAGLDG